MALRHFLTLLDLSSDELAAMLQRAAELKSLQHQHKRHEVLKNRVLAMIFEKSSTRTRVSFEAAMAQAGGSAIFLSPKDTQFGRGEPLEDSARVLSGMVDCVMLRTFDQSILERFISHATVPVINALTDQYHPCQLLADMLTYQEHRGSIQGKTVAWIGDGFNMCHSYINAARRFDFQLNIAAPPSNQPDEKIVAAAGDRIHLYKDPKEAMMDADLVVTDVWASMGQEEETEQRLAIFQAYQINQEMMALAKPDALFMHCLPAHRGEEVTADVIDGEQSVVWQEAENRLHTQKALLEFLMVGAPS